jgi:hypothetical protein
MFLVFLGTHLLRACDFLRPHWVGEYLLGFFTNILVEGHGPGHFVLALLDEVHIVSRLDGSQGIHEIFFSYNCEMAVFFASNGGVSRFVFNQRNLTKIITIFEDIDLRVFMLNPILAVGLIKRYIENNNLHQPDSS